MSFLRGSTSYVWCTTSVLGKGATGAVYQGVNKNNGEPVAVKTFNQLSHMRPHEVQIREFEVLKKVKHENIVKLLAIEEEQEGRGKVIVMELCTGGSLFNILDDPENTYGLQEKEFLLVVEHLSAGMKHLRDNNIVHRDLKPGNIMKFINDDGTTVYKLTDFGAARELKEDQEFMSLYGTEEYLHPDMYERAVLRRPVGKTFGATVDLWSIGVTLYHVATGNLPFRPYGGRKNKETMYYITTRKASGVISGIQTTENGRIEWGRELPIHCQLTVGLKKIITPLLAGLLEVDPEKIWSFERFFSEVQERLGMVAICIFYVNKACIIKVFLRLDDCLKNLQHQICEQTEILANNQIILFNDQLLSSIIEDSTLIKNYPNTSEDNPLMLFSRNNSACCSIGLSSEYEIPKFPVFPNLVSVENDASQAKVGCSVGYVIKRRVEMLALGTFLTGECVKKWTAMLRRALAALATRASSLAVLAARLADTAKALDAVASATDRINQLLNKKSPEDSTAESSANRWSQETQVLNDEMSAGWTAAIGQLHTRYVAGDALQTEWTQATVDIKCPYQHRLPQRAKTLVDKLRDSWQHLVRDRAARSLTYNDEQFHALERVKVTEAGRAAKALLDQDCSPHAAATSEALEDWYKVAQTVYLQSQILDKDLTSADMKLRVLGARMKEGVNAMKEQLDATVKQVMKLKDSPAKDAEETSSDSEIKNKESGTSEDNLEKIDNQAISVSLKTMFSLQDELASVLAQNSELIKCLYLFQKVCKCEDGSS